MLEIHTRKYRNDGMTVQPLLGKRNRSFGFTLVELVVVIGIIVVLWTVGFISLQGHAAKSRDSKRISDINTAMESFEINLTKSGSYPPPDSPFTVTYSGWVVWKQGTFGAGVLTKLSGVGINTVPVDPLTQIPYTYSLLAYRNSYQIQANYEGDSLSYWPIFIDTAYAASGNPSLAIIKGNYDGLVAKTETGGTIYVLAVPSIIKNTGTIGASYEISTGTLSWTLLINAGSNKTGITYNPNQVVFSGAILPNNDTGSGITNIMIALKSAYTGTILTSSPTISTLLSTSTPWLALYGANVIESQLGGKVDF
jgi:type II secretory pathway pseudopilin PulG